MSWFSKSNFSKSEQKELSKLDYDEKSLRKAVQHEKPSLMNKLRKFGSGKIVKIMLMGIMSFSTMNNAFADTGKIVKEYNNFKEWYQENRTEIDNNNISYEEVITKFHSVFENLEKEVKDDIKKHQYEKAINNLTSFYELTERLDQHSISDRCLNLIKDVKNEMTSKNMKDGVYNRENKIIIIGSIKTNDYNKAKRQATTNAREKLYSEIVKIKGKQFSKKGISMKGTIIQKLFREGNNYRYIVSIDLVENAETTRQILQELKKI